jgi:hypothetical protein
MNIWPNQSGSHQNFSFVLTDPQFINHFSFATSFCQLKEAQGKDSMGNISILHKHL